MVVVAPEASIPDIRAYSIDGSARWVTLLNNYISVPAFVEGRSVEVKLPPGGWHRLHTLNALDGGDLLIQWAYMVPTPNQRGKRLAILSAVLRGSKGSGSSLGDSLPTIAAVGSRSYVVLRDGPPPSLEIWKSGRH